ncbi:MAG: hypothetical protein ACYSR5_02570 [Planctomycetota bacterium]
MSKADENEQIDADILECKKDVLRAQDIIPGSAKDKKGDSAPLPASEQKRPEVPRFDLTEEIMAEQRKVTAIKRKGPGEKGTVSKAERQAGAVGYKIGHPRKVAGEESRLIAEIVARDIEMLCRVGSAR